MASLVSFFVVSYISLGRNMRCSFMQYSAFTCNKTVIPESCLILR